MDAFLQIIRNIGTLRLGMMASVAIGLVAFFVFLTTRLTTPNMSLLYGDLGPSDSGQIVAILQNQNIPVEARNKGAEIYVPLTRVGQARLLIAEEGLPGSGTLGYSEIFDTDNALGSSSFDNEIKKLRALEGEISRTITSLDMVKGAKVLLVMPRRELFTRERLVPSASIALRMRGATRLDRNQVLAIQHLVAAAVPGLQPARISIVDDRGTLLARLGDADNPQLGSMTPDEQRIAFENRTASRLTELLERSLGFGKVRVSVSADMDMERVETNEEIYNPEGQVVRSTQTIEDSSQSQDGGPDAVSVGQNLPDSQQLGGGGGSQDQSNRIEEATNFEISKTVKRGVREAGAVTRIAAAVLVDGTLTTGPNGEETYTPRTAEEMEQIEKLVRSTIGFDNNRGDTIEVVNMRFSASAVTDEDIGPQDIFGFRHSELIGLVEKLVLLVVGFLVILLVVRPVISKFFEASAAATEAIVHTAEQQMLTDQSSNAPALAGPGGSVAMAGGGGGEMSADDEAMINLSNIDGRVKASSLRKIGEVIDKHPEEAVSIMRSWMYQDA